MEREDITGIEAAEHYKQDYKNGGGEVGPGDKRDTDRKCFEERRCWVNEF